MDKKSIRLIIVVLCVITLFSVVLFSGILGGNKNDVIGIGNKDNVLSTEKTELKVEPKTSYMIEGIKALPQTDLKAGCEVYACTVLLQYLGFDIDEFEFSNNYLISRPITYDEEFQRYGPDMNSAYAGDVYTIYGYGVYSPAMAKSMNNYLHTTGSDMQAIALKNYTLDRLCQKYIVNDIPVMIWATTYMHEPYVKASWIVNYVDENSDKQIGDVEEWMQNEHCMTLMGFDEENYYFCDSVSGDITAYEKEVSQQRYVELGAQAIVVK